MGEAVIIYGNSGCGKTRSTKEFREDEILFIKVINKKLPFRKKFKYEMVCDDPGKIASTIQALTVKRPEVKAVVIDDAYFIMVNKFMNNHRNKKGDAQYEMYNDIADGMYNLFKYVTTSLPDDMIVYFLMHEDTNDYGTTKISTLGKLLDDKIKVERMVNICLRCTVENNRHVFLTQSNGNDITKSPEDMFEDKMPNDLKAVDTAIREYYGMEPAKQPEEPVQQEKPAAKPNKAKVNQQEPSAVEENVA